MTKAKVVVWCNSLPYLNPLPNCCSKKIMWRVRFQQHLQQTLASEAVDFNKLSTTNRNSRTQSNDLQKQYRSYNHKSWWSLLVYDHWFALLRGLINIHKHVPAYFMFSTSFNSTTIICRTNMLIVFYHVSISITPGFIQIQAGNW